jgi:hypothetical protein
MTTYPQQTPRIASNFLSAFRLIAGNYFRKQPPDFTTSALVRSLSGSYSVDEVTIVP